MEARTKSEAEKKAMAENYFVGDAISRGAMDVWEERGMTVEETWRRRSENLYNHNLSYSSDTVYHHIQGRDFIPSERLQCAGDYSRKE
jgi:hypothetical protein